MISLPGMWWGYAGSLDMLEYEAMRSAMSSRGVAQLGGFLGLSRPWEFLGGMYKRSSVVVWSTSTGQVGGALVAPKDRPVN